MFCDITPVSDSPRFLLCLANHLEELFESTSMSLKGGMQESKGGIHFGHNLVFVLRLGKTKLEKAE